MTHLLDTVAFLRLPSVVCSNAKRLGGRGSPFKRNRSGPRELERMGTPILITERKADYQDTDRSTAQTVDEMCGHVRSCMSDPVLHQIAYQVCSESGSTRRDRCIGVWRWLKQNIKFVHDETQLFQTLGRSDELELLISPSVMVRPELLEQARGVRQMQGDCDCFVMTGLVLLALCGVPPVIETIKCDRREPWRWSHVCAGGVLEDGSVFPVDASHGLYAGWRIPEHDIFASQYWDTHGNKAGGDMRRGISGYESQPGWTGNEMTTVTGPAAGPYPQLDFMRYYYRGRPRTLNSIARAKYSGLGDFDPASAAIDSSDYSSSSSSYLDNSPGPDYTDTVTGQRINGATGEPYPSSSSSSSGGFLSFLSSLVNPAVALTSKALQPNAQVLPNGNVLLPNGQIVAGTPTASSINPNLLVYGGLAIGALLLVSALKK